MKKSFTIVLLLLGIVINSDILIAQSFGWAKQFTGNSNSQGFEITTDTSGNSITSGIFTGTIDFDPGPGIFNMSAVWNGDIYVSKLDVGGNFVWAKCFQNTFYKEVTDIKTDSAGNVYITGWFNGVIDFDPGPAIYNLTANITDIFICKLDASGNFLWAVKMGGSNVDAAWSLALDAWGNVITTGIFSGIADFDPGPGTFNITAPINSQLTFVSKLDNSGNFIWAKSFTTTTISTPTSTGTDLLGNIYTCGWFNQTLDLDPGPAIFNLTATGGKDIFLSKLDSVGNFVWAKKISGNNDEECTAMHVDPTGFISLTGIFKGTTDFDPGSGIYNLVATGTTSGFVTKLDPYGNMFWAKQFAGDLILEPAAITVDAFSNVIITGRFLGTADFNPDSAIYFGYSPFYFNGFVCSLNNSGNFRWTHTLESLTDNNQINSIATDQYGSLFLTGVFEGGVDFNPGSGTSYMTSFLSYNAFVWKLQYCNISTSTITDSGCLHYLSPGGNFIWTSSGVYNDIITSASGCDSIVTVNLTINFVDTSVTAVGPALTSNALNASYQWINCASGNIPGAINQNFTATSNGNYAVIVTQNGCTDTSQCILVNSVSLSDLPQQKEISFSPNPVNDRLFIKWDGILPDVGIVVSDITGRVMFLKHIGTASMTEIEFPFSPGFYQVHVLNGAKQQAVFKIVKH